MIREFEGRKPDIHPDAYVHETAEIIGRVKIGARASIWPYVVIRGDVEDIVIGEGTNIQDGTVIHTDFGIPTTLGKGISVGHSVNLHGCRVADNCLIGIGSILLNRSVIEEESIVAAGAVVAPGMVVPPRQMVMGVPGRVVRPLRQDEIDHIHKNAEAYLLLQEKHKRTSKAIAR
jgi:carbonic anhydrase/acetyltransferase-like protein (isoleucine patch superfamily)